MVQVNEIVVVYEFTITPDPKEQLNKAELLSIIHNVIDEEAQHWIPVNIDWEVNDNTGVVSVTVYGIFND